MADIPAYNTREEVDFVIIGSGAAGGIIAKELSTAGFSTVVLEQGKSMSNFQSKPHSILVIYLSPIRTLSFN